MPEQTGRFTDKVLFATGGASGIAEQVAIQFTAQGGRVAIVDVTPERAEVAAAKLDGAIGLGADVADEASVEAAVASPPSAGVDGRLAWLTGRPAPAAQCCQTRT